MKKIATYLTCLCALLFMFTSCEEANTYNGITGMVENLPQLAGNYEYAAWIIESGNSRLMGEVVPDSDGTAFLAFAPLPDQIRDASSILITIEDGSTAYNAPSSTQVLVSNFASSDQAVLTSSVIGSTFENIEGKFILDSPTTTSTSTDNTGVWFVNSDIQQGLLLPVLEEGWKYEGWVIFNQTPISTGKFSDPGMADEANIYGGNEDPYPFPGEDFNNPSAAPAGVNMPQDLKGKMVKISVEPDPDDSSAPYPLILLEGTVGNPSVTKTDITMEAKTDLLPSGTVSKEKE